MQGYRKSSKDSWFGIDQAIKNMGSTKKTVKNNNSSLFKKPDGNKIDNILPTTRYVMQIREAFKRNMG
tara:strand:+ start:767 stop:970 length:204 start_codon:yes stop_codon:yes gene_type:complete